MARGESASGYDTGLMGFRYPEEPPDNRPVLRWSQFWADESERMAYEQAVGDNPQRADETPKAYMVRIATLVTGRYKQAGLTMPRRMSNVEWQRRQNELKAQAWRNSSDW